LGWVVVESLVTTGGGVVEKEDDDGGGVVTGGGLFVVMVVHEVPNNVATVVLVMSTGSVIGTCTVCVAPGIVTVTGTVDGIQVPVTPDGKLEHGATVDEVVVVGGRVVTELVVDVVKVWVMTSLVVVKVGDELQDCDILRRGTQVGHGQMKP